MNSKKLMIITGIVAASVAAHAQVALTGAGKFSLGGSYKSLLATPTYTSGSSITSLDLSADHGNVPGSINQWWFSDVSAKANLTTATYQITLSGINKYTTIFGLITANTYNPKTKAVGPGVYDVDSIYDLNVESYTGSTASTQTLDFTVDLTADHTKTAFFKGNFQVQAVPEPSSIAVMGLGALGLVIRRRRRVSK